MGVASPAGPWPPQSRRLGQLGVVSGTALEVVCTRRLQHGDPGGARAPRPGAVPRPRRGRVDPGRLLRARAGRPTHATPSRRCRAGHDRTQQLGVPGARPWRPTTSRCCLAKEGHAGARSASNLPARRSSCRCRSRATGRCSPASTTPSMGAGNPRRLPGLRATGSPRGEDRRWPVAGPGRARSADGDRRRGRPGGAAGLPRRPALQASAVLAIVASATWPSDPRPRVHGGVGRLRDRGTRRGRPQRAAARRRARLDAERRAGLRRARRASTSRPIRRAGPAGLARGLLRHSRAACAAPLSGGRDRRPGGHGVRVLRGVGHRADDSSAPRSLDQLATGEVSRAQPTGGPRPPASRSGGAGAEAPLSDADGRTAARSAVCDLGAACGRRTARPTAGVGYRCPSEPHRRLAPGAEGRSRGQHRGPDLPVQRPARLGRNAPSSGRHGSRRAGAGHRRDGLRPPWAACWRRLPTARPTRPPTSCGCCWTG